ncbi:carbohydrate ABC transporter permease [Herbiconiux sp. VKM Ac-1786]|jgi:multiple sugar transport system permease protein|uniref:carbohydrate ABC transporter permease n=1 Tax=Herbiconiux sp. VKM Ac-1786 TaxID=2783824 RepID=UPI00188C1E8B|nr:carbohydrate ABC transporter permease [Herbiconiux sp. VKM Ac-1786]MBF4572553.1 carbohydrate ABC transporter permease [Herbiconiux sp. VKM Ac-1786]
MTTILKPTPRVTTEVLTTPERPKTPRGRTISRFSPGRAVAWLYIVIVLVVTVFPFYWMLRTAFSNNYSLIRDPGSLLPVDFTWGAFARVLGIASQEQSLAEGGSGASIEILHFLLNSVIYATVQTVAIVFFSTIAAYAFARLRWKGRDLMFSIFLAALMVPGILTLLPNFVLVKDLGLLNTFAGMILPTALFSAFNIFFLRQFMLGLSEEVEEAALIDGAGRLRVLFRITLPMTSGPIITLSILGFITAWNDYFWPLLVTSDDSVRPLTLALAVFKQSSPQASPDWAGLMAATLVAALPMLLLFLVFGKRIVNSIGFTGLK